MDFGDLMTLLQAQEKLPLKGSETQTTRMVRTMNATLTNKELARSMSFMLNTVAENPLIVMMNHLAVPILMGLSIVVESRLDLTFNLEDLLKEYEAKHNDN